MIRDLLNDSLRDIRVHWLRVLLTSSGIIWGIGLFMLMATMGAASNRHFQERVQAIGRKVVYGFPGPLVEHGKGARAVRQLRLEMKDPPRLLSSPLIERSAPQLELGLRVLKGNGHIKVVWSYGVGPDTAIIRNFEIDRGRFITERDIHEHAHVLVLGAKVEQRLFGRRSALDQEVLFDGYPFRVVGVSRLKGAQMINLGPRDDEQVLIPASTAQALFTGSKTIDYVLYEPLTREQALASEMRARTIFARHHYFRPDMEEALTFFNVSEILQSIGGISTALEIFFAACGAMTLLVGGIGVMNIMLVAVAERTRDLGLRKALGAAYSDLFLQIMAETMLITVGSGVIGMMLGGGLLLMVGSYGVQPADENARMLIPHITFSPPIAMLSFLLLTGVGVLAGLIPAGRAARLDPAIALREE